VRKDEYSEFLEKNKVLTTRYKEVSIGETNDKLSEHIEEFKKDIGKLGVEIGTYRKKGLKMVT